MHFRGRSMRISARYPGDREELMLSVPRYDFNWQLEYVLARPRRIPRGTRLMVRATYDDSRLNRANPDPRRDVEFGLQSWDEMLIGWYYYYEL